MEPTDKNKKEDPHDLDYDFKLEISEVKEEPTWTGETAGWNVRGKWEAAANTVQWTRTPNPHKCSKCEVVLLSKHELLRHMRAAHNAWMSCPDCDKRFRIKKSFEKHIRKVHQKLPLQKRKCEHCNSPWE